MTQFHHPHAFRAQVVEALQAELPEVWCDLLAAGAQPITAPAGPNGTGAPEQVMGIRCRRLTFERVLRAAAEREPGVDLHVGHVDEVCTDRGRSALTPAAPSSRGASPGQAAGSTLPRWSQIVRPSRNRTPSAHRASTAPPANCSV